MPELINLKNIEKIIIRNCSIIRAIPESISNCSELTYLDLSFNNLTGGIPKSMENLKLNKLFLTSNMLSGNVNLSWLKKMELADLSFNNYTTSIFPSNPTKNMRLDNRTIDIVRAKAKTETDFTEPSRSSISRMGKAFCGDKHRKYDSLRINCGGSITRVPGAEDEYEADNHTSNFFVSSNRRWAYVCTGEFMFTDANHRDYVKKASCGLSPSEETIHETARLCPQSLTYYVFCLQKGDYNVTLHFSEIGFLKRKNKSNLRKRIFDIYIQGKREKKDFSTTNSMASNISIISLKTTVNEDSLLTIHFFWAGKGSQYLPNYLSGLLISAIIVTRVRGESGPFTSKIIGIVIGSVLAASLLLLAFMWRIGWIGDRELRVTSVKLRDKWYTLKQVKDATRNFSPRNEIGQGRFGIVYKAELPDQTVAVKKLSLQSNLDQVGTEVYALKNLKHDNLVELLDAYSKKDLNLLIYEYMERGSLEKALFEDQDSNKLQLDWQTRVNISLGIAKGLKYLHEENPNRQIIHRNMKASNILLDGNLNAKVSDLGLAKLYDEENPYNFIQEIGTVVYMAPEYAMRKAITDKVDVYSYGVVVLEIVSRRIMQREAYGLVDKKLSTYWQQAHDILHLAMMCVDQSPAVRPTMSEVGSVLEGEKNIQQISKAALSSA
ncbi:probable LRR receptor-like serine/threonine-protein kinase At1g07650 [Pistacia vera]|uniref:probable LRR receptor-like serine/threonine-protein kinase At1g07650 n=1 Tax=Pistacia vera TaxID=55513 RepID=UPI0012632AC0|nr:probable LRR receptor-like serine/threonine-protein kinase At1g07650 [Pistacia vera]